MTNEYGEDESLTFVMETVVTAKDITNQNHLAPILFDWNNIFRQIRKVIALKHHHSEEVCLTIIDDWLDFFYLKVPLRVQKIMDKIYEELED